MWEVKSLGVTVELTRDHAQAATVYQRCYGSDVRMYAYDSQGNKRVVSQRTNHGAKSV